MNTTPSHASAAGPAPRRILVRGTNWLGDAVMTTPALLRLREKFPAAHIALLCPEKLRELWQQHPAVNEIIPFRPEEGLWAVSRRLAKRKRDERFELALVLPNSPRSALEAFIARIPQRVGYSRPWRNFFLTQAIPARPGAVPMHKRSDEEIESLVAGDLDGRHNSVTRLLDGAFPGHQSREYLHLAGALGASSEPVAPQLFVAPGEIEVAKKKFGLKLPAGPLFGLNPGAEYGPAKRWPAERYIAAARAIQARTGCVWVLFGGKNDEAITAQIQAAVGTRPGVINLAGQTSLRDLMALMKLCSVVLTNDSGPMHVAAALGTPVVAPFGSTSPELTGPGLPGDPRNYLFKSNAVCAPCFLRECPIDFRCMNAIDVEPVVEAVVQAAKR